MREQEVPPLWCAAINYSSLSRRWRSPTNSIYGDLEAVTGRGKQHCLAGARHVSVLDALSMVIAWWSAAGHSQTREQPQHTDCHGGLEEVPNSKRVLPESRRINPYIASDHVIFHSDNISLFYSSTAQQNFLWWWKYSISTLSGAITMSHVWPLNT